MGTRTPGASTFGSVDEGLLGCTNAKLAHRLHSYARMGAIDKFIGRFGYAKLDRYGLILTPDDRVLSTRPAVLDDGLGSKIVGWTEDDLAAMELDHWGAAPKAAAAKPVAAPKSLHRPAPPPIPKVKLPGVAQVISPVPGSFAVPVAAPIVAPAPVVAAAPVVAVAPVFDISAPVVASAPAPAPVVAEEPVVEEDEWEWEIAMARARAAAEWAAEAAEVAKSILAPPAPGPIRRKTPPGLPAVHANIAQPIAPAIAAKPIVPPIPKAPVLPERKTVIPVPQIVTAARPSDLRPYTPAGSVAPRRLPRGTGPVTEDTVRTQAAPPPANDDNTSPYVTIPNEVKPVGYAHTKRVAAKQR